MENDEIANKCLNDLISPNQLCKKNGITADNIRVWIRKMGKPLPQLRRIQISHGKNMSARIIFQSF